MNLRYILYGFTILIYISTAFHSLGFDDEFFNVNLVEQHGFSAFLVTQLEDMHPPLSYLLNAFLYEALGSWSGVRLVSAITICAAFFYVCENIGKEYGNRAAVLTFLLLATNPATLLWGTSIRWYAYYLPVLLWLLVIPKNQNASYWAKLAIGLVILGYIGYITFLIAPALILVYWFANSQDFKIKLKYFLICLGIASIAYLHQLLIFFNVHLLNSQSQFGSIFSSISGVFISQFSNQGVFPISIAGLMGAVGMFIMMYLALSSQPIQSLKHNQRFISYALFVMLTVVSGISAKFRNLLLASPFQALWLGTTRPKDGAKKVFYLGLSLVLASNFWGMFNVYRHQDTTKNSWNLPIEQALTYLQGENYLCNGDTIFFVHDPAISYHLVRLSLNTSGPYLKKKIVLKDSFKCVFIIKTFQGSISNERYGRMLHEFEKLNFSKKTFLNIQPDSFYNIKVKLDNRYPLHVVSIIKLENVDNVKVMASWLP